MQILVTGGAGYIGGHVCLELLKEGFTPVVLDNLSTGKKEYVPNECNFIQGDIQDQSVLNQIFSDFNIDGVIHLAASLEVGESWQQPLKYLRQNLTGTTQVASTAASHRVKSFINASTAAVYGSPGNSLVTEDFAKNPESPYGRSKLLAEQSLEYIHEYKSLPLTHLRFFNVCGTKLGSGILDTHPASHLITIVLEVARGVRTSLVINGNDYNTFDGTPVRDYVHVEDIATAHVLALKAQLGGKPYQVYNIGTGKGASVLQVITAASEVTRRMIPCQVGPRRSGDPESVIASPSKIQHELGFSPKFQDVHSIIRTAWEIF